MNEGPFSTLKAADVMTHDVLAIPIGTTMREAALLLARARISGAPVVDAEGRCPGVLSAADFFRSWVNENLEMAPTDVVGEHMRTKLVKADSATPIRELARMIVDADVHRLIVVDERQRPVGVVSSTDFLAAVARASK
jgi:CBS-domain-containing membrane protein